MLQCKDCEYFDRDSGGSPHLMCDPFETIVEPECIAKWQLMELRVVAQAHRATLDMYARLAPLQEKLFKHVEREINEAEEVDRWKLGGEDSDDDDDDDDDDDPFRI
ncbi:MAG: hypothetical protein ACE5HE_02645 [Phycisphaerae bacterium]